MVLRRLAIGRGRRRGPGEPMEGCGTGHSWPGEMCEAIWGAECMRCKTGSNAPCRDEPMQCCAEERLAVFANAQQYSEHITTLGRLRPAGWTFQWFPTKAEERPGCLNGRLLHWDNCGLAMSRGLLLATVGAKSNVSSMMAGGESTRKQRERSLDPGEATYAYVYCSEKRRYIRYTRLDRRQKRRWRNAIERCYGVCTVVWK